MANESLLKNGVVGGGCPVSGSGPSLRAQGAGKSKNANNCPMGSFHVPESYKGHPGGQAMLKIAAESDTPALLYLSYHIGRDLDGKIATAARAMGCTPPKRGPIYDEIHEAVQRVRAEHPEQRFIFAAWCLVLTLLMVVGFVWWIVAPSVVLSCIVALLFECYFLNIFHTRHHKGGKLYEVELLDKLTAPLYECIDRIWGYYPPAWHTNHHVRHHLHTNDLQLDPDVPDTHPLVRISEDQPKSWYMKFQTFYWPFLLPFSVARFPVQNVLKYGGGMSFFSLWLVLMFVVPFALHGYFGIGCSALIQGLTGVLITYKFSVSHTHGELGNAMTGKVKGMNVVDEWVVNQIEESMSWGGYFATFFWGGINMQVEHHICPALEPPLYYFIQAEMLRICEKHGIRYTKEPSLFHAVYRFHQHLWMLG